MCFFYNELLVANKKEYLPTEFVKELIMCKIDTTPAKDIAIYFGSRASSKYNKEYPKKKKKT